MEKGELWLASLPEQVGREEIGTRPVLIISEMEMGLVILIQLTSNLKRLVYSSTTLKIEKSQKNGLAKDSVALLFQMRAVDKKRLLHKIGVLENVYLEQINKKLQELLKI